MARPRLWHALLVLAACAIAFWPTLGTTGLSMTEGHRVGVAWEWLNDSHPDWLVTRLFERAYVRKPQGVPWLLAGSSALLGQTEFAVRAVSAAAATLTALIVWCFAGRWFGWRSAWIAGCGMALLPWSWESARAAEIEAVHTLGVALAALALIDLLARPGRGARVVMGLTAGAGVTIALLSKGPAGAIVMLSGVAGACLAARSWRTLVRAGMLVALSLPALLCGGVAMATWLRLRGLDEPIVSQGVGDFLWESGKAMRVVALAPTALAMALPASLALLLPWGPDARRETLRSDAEAQARRMALACAWAVLFACLAMSALGVANPRYLLPITPLAAAPIAYAWRGARGAFLPHRARIAKALFLGHPGVWGAVLVGASVWYTRSYEPAQRASSGRAAGNLVASTLTSFGEPAELWGDFMVEARPEVLLYAQRDAGVPVRARWMRPGDADAPPPSGTWLLLRTDGGGDERAWLKGLAARAMASGRVHKFEWSLYRVD